MALVQQLAGMGKWVRPRISAYFLLGNEQSSAMVWMCPLKVSMLKVWFSQMALPRGSRTFKVQEEVWSSGTYPGGWYQDPGPFLASFMTGLP